MGVKTEISTHPQNPVKEGLHRASQPCRDEATKSGTLADQVPTHRNREPRTVGRNSSSSFGLDGIETSPYLAQQIRGADARVWAYEELRRCRSRQVPPAGPEATPGRALRWSSSLPPRQQGLPVSALLDQRYALGGHAFGIRRNGE